MSDVHPEIASHVPLEGTTPVRLHGGPWDGKDVWVHDPDAPFVQVNGPRHGRHSVWITHLYRRDAGGYAFVRTEEVSITAYVSPSDVGLGNRKGDS